MMSSSAEAALTREAAATRNLAVCLSKPHTPLIVHTALVIPALLWNAQRTTRGDHVVNELLGTETLACLGWGGLGPSTLRRYAVPASVMVAFQVGPCPDVSTRPRVRNAAAEIRADTASGTTLP